MMAKRTIKNLGRRGLALFLSLVMMTSLMQVTAFAAQYKDQTMEGYYTVASDGTVGTTDATYVEQDGFTLKKEITQTGKDAFDITLTVQTSQTVSKTYDRSATVLVLDMSNSMDYNFGDQTTRLNEAEKVAKEFLASYAGTDADAEQYLSIVWFGTSSGVDQAWVNVAGGAGQNSYDTVYNYLDALDEAPHSGDTGGTNLESGLKTVQDQLALRSTIDEYKNVVVITDGKPTYRIGGGNGSSGSKANNDAAAARADAIQETATIYTVCIAAESDVCYSGSTQYVCEKCLKSRDEHIEVHLCDNCGKAFDEHTRQKGKKGGSYYSCPGANAPYEKNERYSDETYYYCDETLEQQYEGTSVTVGGVTVGDFLKNDIASSTSNAYNASSAEELENALAAIAAKIEESGSTGKDTSVVDPMGEFVIMGDINIEGVTDSAAGLTWELDPSKASKETVGDVTTYTYTITYPITLNTAAPGFKEFNEDGSVKYYPTNGYTYLSVPQADGSTKPIAFLVPGVSGKVPEVNWTVEYYIQNDAALGDYENYTHVEKFDKTFKDVDVWTSVQVPDYEDDVYMSKFYSSEYKYHTFEEGNVVMQVQPITEDHPENVMRVYYKRTSNMVNVNHFYKTDELNYSGEFIKGTYPETPQASLSESALVCDEYTAKYEYEHGGASYELDNKSDKPTITVSKDGDNTINLYYTREVDNRQKVSAEVRHQYITYSYQINPDTGKYEKVVTDDTTKTAQEGRDLRVTTLFGVDPTLRVSPFDNSYVLNTDKGDYNTLTNKDGELSFALVDDSDDAEANVRTLVYEKTVENREPITISVDHHYTKYVTTVENGEPVKQEPEDYHRVEGTEETWYVGETFQAVEDPTYDGEVYEPAANNNTDEFVLAAADDGKVITLNYTRTELPNATTILVKHHFRTITDITRERTETITNDDGSTTTVVIGTYVDTVTTEDEDLYKQTESPSLYEGQNYTVAPDGEEGYTFNEAYSLKVNGLTEEEKWRVEATYPEQLVINLYYDKSENNDARQTASIAVEHIYTTYLTSVVGGKVVENAERYDGNEVVNYPIAGEDMRAGDEFTATPDTTYGEYKDYELVGDAPAKIILQPGSNGKIVLNYKRFETQLDQATYTVNYEYNVYQMVINAAGEPEYVLDTENSWTDSFTPAEGEVFYVGEDVTLDAGIEDGFTLVTDINTTQRLKAEGNTWTFVHEKKVDLPQNTVTVNHYYTTTTIAANGTSSDATDKILGAPVTKYVGQAVHAEAVVTDGFTLVSSELIYGEVAAAEDAVQSSYDVVVTEQPAVVNFYYERTIDNSVFVNYEIRHEYYLYDYNDSETPIEVEKPDPVTGTAILESEITGTPTPNGYKLVSATYNGAELAAPYTIELQEGENVIIFRYELTLPRDAVDVTVIHNYYKDVASMTDEPAKFENQFVQTIPEVSEDSVYTAAEYYMENAAYTYTFRSANPESKSITVTDDGENVIVMNYIRATAEYQVIHIYNRNGVEEGRTSETLGGLDGDVVLADSIERVPVFEGRTYTFQSITGDITLDADEMQTITLVYNRKTSGGGGGGGGYTPPVVIPDEEPPLAELPDEEPPLAELPDEEPPLAELPEEEVPLALAPMTGDTTALYALSALGSAMGLMYLWLTGKKREEDA